jgi:hypothetical protein
VVCCCCCLAPINPLGYSHKLHVCSQSEAAGVFVHILIAKTTLYLCVSIKYSVEIRYAPPGATNPRQKLFACVHYFCCDKTPAAAHCVILCSSLEFQHACIPLFILLRIKCLSPRNTKQRISIMPIIIMNLVKLRRGKSAPVLSSTQRLPLRLSISFAPMHTIVIYIPCMNAHIQKSLAAKLALPLASWAGERTSIRNDLNFSLSWNSTRALCAREKTYFQCAHGDDECRLGCNLEIIPSMLGVCSAPSRNMGCFCARRVR